MTRLPYKINDSKSDAEITRKYKAEMNSAEKMQNVIKPDLSKVPDFEIHIPGHDKWKWFIPLFLLACCGVLFLILKVSL